MEYIAYLATVLMGIILGLVGGGGAILTVPILVYLFHIDPVIASGYSLFIVGAASAVGSLRSLRHRMIDIPVSFNFAIPSFVGVFCARSLVLPALPQMLAISPSLHISKGELLMILFALIMLVASVSMIRGRREGQAPAPSQGLTPQTRFWIAAQGLAVGLLAGLVGAGGGFMIIPGLVMLVGLPMKRAVASSLFIIALQSSFGFLGEWAKGTTIDWSLLLSLASLAVVGMVVGSRFQQFIPEKKLRIGFGYFVLLMGLWILVQQLR